MPIDLNELAEWCANNDMPIDGNARSQYAAMKLREKHEENEEASELEKATEEREASENEGAEAAESA